MKKLIFSICIILIGLFSCKNSETVTKTDTTLQKIAVGKGGGFTGAYTEFLLQEDGKVFKKDFKYDRDVFTKTITKEELSYFWNKMEALNLDGVEINKPGNISTYIEIKEGDLSIDKIIWGANSYYPPSNIVEFHKELFKKLSAVD